MAEDDPDEGLQDVATGGDTATVDLEDLVDDLEAEAAELRDLRERAQAIDDSDGEDDVEWPPEEYAGSADPVREVEHAADLVRSDIDDFGGSEFVVRKARAGEMTRAQDLVAADALQTDGDARANVASSRHRLVQVCVAQAPPEAPTTADGRLKTAEFEHPTFEHLYQSVDNFNTYGEVSLEDF